MPAFLTPIFGFLFFGALNVAEGIFNVIKVMLGFASASGIGREGGGILASTLAFMRGGSAGSISAPLFGVSISDAGDFLKSPLAAVLLCGLVFLSGYYFGNINSKTEIKYIYTKRAIEVNAKADELERQQTKQLDEHDKKLRDIVNDVRRQCQNQKCTLTPALVDRLQQLR